MRRLVALALFFAGCGGGPSAPSKPPRETIMQANFTARRGGFASATFSTTRAGTLSVVVDWSDARNDIDLALVNPPCDPAGNLSGCVFFGSDTNKVGKPAQVVVSSSPNSYRVVILNFGPNDDGGVLNVYLD